MRTMLAVCLLSTLATACGGGESAGAEEARRQAEEMDKAKMKSGPATPATKIKPPVPGETKIPCEQLIDLPAFTTALGEKEPLTIKDNSKGEVEAAAKCALVRGGKKLSEAEQKAALKKDGHLGVLPGDDTCVVTAFCYTIEDADRFKKKCEESKNKAMDHGDDTMGSYACVHVEAVGENDVQIFKFFDTDTKCILKVAGGPGMVDNDYIRNCAKTARDTITPEKIAVAAAAPK